MNIYVENCYDPSYARFWRKLGAVCTNRTQFLADPQAFSLVAFTGGEDVSPELYNHRNLASHCSIGRDLQEKETFRIALSLGIPMTGICRGAQFLSVACGGSMVQHLRESHGGSGHLCQTQDGEEFEVTSSHHQMIVPGSGGKVLAWAKQRLLLKDCVYDGELPQSVADDYGSLNIRVTEAVYYPQQKVFGCQFHAEWMDPRSNAAEWQLQMTKALLLEPQYLRQA